MAGARLVRYRHTDSDLFRLARQQLFVKAVKQAVNHNWKNPRTVPRLLGAMRKNVEVGQAGRALGQDWPTTRSSPTGCPPATSSRSNRRAQRPERAAHRPANIKDAVQQFIHPDVQAPEKATAAAPGASSSSKNGPSPRSVSIVVLNGNGKPGAAANTSYLLGQKGYRMLGPPEGFQANAPGRWERTFRTQSSTRRGEGAARGAAGLGALQLVRDPADAEAQQRAPDPRATARCCSSSSARPSPAS